MKVCVGVLGSGSGRDGELKMLFLAARGAPLMSLFWRWPESPPTGFLVGWNRTRALQRTPVALHSSWAAALVKPDSPRMV